MSSSSSSSSSFVTTTGLKRARHVEPQMTLEACRRVFPEEWCRLSASLEQRHEVTREIEAQMENEWKDYLDRMRYEQHTRRRRPGRAPLPIPPVELKKEEKEAKEGKEKKEGGGGGEGLESRERRESLERRTVEATGSEERPMWLQKDQFATTMIIPLGCLRKWGYRDMVGEGTIGNVYEACLLPEEEHISKGERGGGGGIVGTTSRTTATVTEEEAKEKGKRQSTCQYVVKILGLEKPGWSVHDVNPIHANEGELTTRTEFEVEVANSRRMGELGIGPRVHDAWICDSTSMLKVAREEEEEIASDEAHEWVREYIPIDVGFLVMDRMDDSVLDWAQRHWQTPTFDTDLKNIRKQIAKVTAAMHEAGVIHHDLHADNIMWKRQDQGDDASETPGRLYFIDFPVLDPVQSNQTLQSVIDYQDAEVLKDLGFKIDKWKRQRRKKV